MKHKKLLLPILSIITTATLLLAPGAGAWGVKSYAAGEAAAFQGITLTKGYKDLSNHNPCVTQKFSADPGAMEYNGRVYVYCTNDGDQNLQNPAENTYGQITHINVMSSADMVNWTDHGSIDVAGRGGAASWATNSWAPCACHKKINGQEKFFLYFANSGGGIGVLTADSPTGPWKDPIGKALITRSTPNCSNVEWLFDPAVLVDDDGTGYLYFGGGVPSGKSSNPQTHRVVKLGSDMTSLAGNPVTIDAPWSFEDSGINKVGNTYYYTYCTNWNGGPYGNARIAYMTSSSPMGPFTYKGTCLNNPGDFFGTTGNNHHSIVTLNGQSYIFYHAEWLNKQMFGSQKGYRTTHVDTISFSNGKINNAKGTLTGVSQVKNLDAFTKTSGATFAWQAGVNVYGTGDAIAAYSRGDWSGVSGLNFGSGATSVSLSVASKNGGVIRMTQDKPDGKVLGYLTIPATGDNLTFTDVTCSFDKISGVKNVFFTMSDDIVISSWQFGNGTATQDPSQGTTTDKPVNTGSVATIQDGWYYIKNVNAQKYLQVTGNTGKAVQNVEIGTGSGVDGQKWYVTNTGDGYITLTNKLGNFMLDVANGEDVDGANLQIYTAWGGDAQQFAVMTTSTDGVYIIGTKSSNKTKVVDVYEHGTKDGTNVCQWSYNGKTNQQWTFEPVSGNNDQPSDQPSEQPKEETGNQTGGQTQEPENTPSETPSQTSLPTGVTATYTVVDNWGGSFHCQIVIENNSGKTLSNWTLTFDYANSIDNLWNAQLSGQSGTTVTVTAPSWNADLASGSSITIDFIASGDSSAVPTNFAVK
ncbi:arabinoxylan arabinofuranohydrolase [Butyrivibrio fibrisolvens DSM 3071]|uniref:Arabinoxylan arabinofuranohydrolase n=1 Tax=Butyrivibrio fibrisolvens DSM 3071 TaxID=1121131 RepID=A0A1M5YP39_BUTFI|nr:family 43 glycosylhydrolase [Butyrivibrio fibrisolvens]SHI13905.1 arabinoxylan arabinofuranohydrolase [Butyrivibrio fibrisolvens DSM 3071]